MTNALIIRVGLLQSYYNASHRETLWFNYVHCLVARIIRMEC